MATGYICFPTPTPYPKTSAPWKQKDIHRDIQYTASAVFFIAGDLIHGATLQILHPEFCASYDQQAEQAASTRRYYLEYVRRNHLIMAGMHLPAPGFWEP